MGDLLGVSDAALWKGAAEFFVRLAPFRLDPLGPGRTRGDAVDPDPLEPNSTAQVRVRDSTAAFDEL